MGIFGPRTFIGRLKINNVKSSSINFGPSIHIGHQANQKIVTGEIVIGDEITINIGCPKKEKEENGENNNNFNMTIDGKFKL